MTATGSGLRIAVDSAHTAAEEKSGGMLAESLEQISRKI